MAQSGYTPILVYASGTTGTTPLAANLTSSSSGAELALNYFDGKLFYKDASGVVQVLATKGAGTIGGSNTQVQYNSSGALAGSANLTFDGTTLTANALTTTSTVTINGGTANGVLYLNASKVATSGSAITFDGASLFLGPAPAYTPDSTWIGLFANSTGSFGSFNTNTHMTQNAYFNAGWKYLTSAGATNIYCHSNGSIIFRAASAGVAGTTLTWTTVADIRTTGAVFSGGINSTTIGATTPSTGAFTEVLVGTTSSVTGSKLVVDTGDATIYGVRVGRGAGAVATNTAVGNNALVLNTSGSNSVGVGASALYNQTTAGYNTAVGVNAIYGAGAGMTGSSNVGIGASALEANSSGANNVAIGRQALVSNTTASNNTAVGYQAGYTNTTGASLVAIGKGAAYTFNTTGENQGTTIVGTDAGYNTSTGKDNAALGARAMYTNSTGSNHVAIGSRALYSNTTSANNVAVGADALYGNTGASNTAVGYGSGSAITTGGKNTLLGGYNGNQDGLDIRTASNYAVISDGDGNRLLSTANGYSLALDGGAVPQSGTGITFPATQSASSDANTLDDYEEGTWTPSVGGTATYTTQSGFYTKIGRQVTIWADLTISSIGTGSTSQISGNPFTPAAGITYMPGSVYWENLAISETSLIAVTQGSTGTIWFSGRATSATSIDNQVAILGNSARVRFCITYNI